MSSELADIVVDGSHGNRTSEPRILESVFKNAMIKVLPVVQAVDSDSSMSAFKTWT